VTFWRGRELKGRPSVRKGFQRCETLRCTASRATSDNRRPSSCGSSLSRSTPLIEICLPCSPRRTLSIFSPRVPRPIADPHTTVAKPSAALDGVGFVVETMPRHQHSSGACEGDESATVATDRRESDHPRGILACDGARGDEPQLGVACPTVSDALTATNRSCRKAAVACGAAEMLVPVAPRL
jgi:hypothetical protein